MIKQQTKILVEIEIRPQDKSSFFDSIENNQWKVLNDEFKILTIKTVYPKGFEGFKNDLLDSFKEKLSLQL